jgi:hypothetical protein
MPAAPSSICDEQQTGKYEAEFSTTKEDPLFIDLPCNRVAILRAAFAPIPIVPTMRNPIDKQG